MTTEKLSEHGQETLSLRDGKKIPLEGLKALVW